MIHTAVVVNRANDPGPSDVSAGGPSPTKTKPADVNTRMLDLNIKIARVLMKHPQVLRELRFFEQKFGNECLCDSPSKLEKVIHGCGGIGSAGLGFPI